MHATTIFHEAPISLNVNGMATTTVFFS